MGGESGEIGLPVHSEASQEPSAAEVNPRTGEAEARLDLASKPERVSAFFTVATRRIREKEENGAFDSNKELKEKAKLAGSFKGSTEVTREASDSVKATIEVLEAVKTEDPEMQRILDETVPNLRIKVVNEDGTDNRYTLEEWRQKLEASTPEERARFESEGLYGFQFPKEKTQESVGPAREKSTGEVIAVQALQLEAEIVAAKAEGKNTNNQKQLLTTLRLAEQANGEVGVLLKAKALQDLKASGVGGLEELIQRVEGQRPGAEQRLMEHLKASGLSEEEIASFVGLTGKEGLDKMIAKGAISGIEGLDKLIFGRELSEEELDKILDNHLGPEEKKSYLGYGKKTGLALLLLLLLSGMGMSKITEDLGGGR